MAAIILSEEEKHFIIAGVEEDFRNDGRSCEDYRIINVQSGIISNTNGSAQVKLAGTNVLIGIKAVIGEPIATAQNEGRLEFFVDCSANASPVFEGRGGSDLALALSGALQRTFCHGALDLHSLCVIPGIKAALHDTRIPDLSIIGAGAEKDIEVSDDPYDVIPLDISNVPVLVTLNKISNRYVVDATPEEEVCSDSRLLISINEKGRVCSTQIDGNGAIHPDLLFEMMQVGQKIGKVINTKLEEVLKLQTKEW